MYWGGWLQTFGAHPLVFSTTNGKSQLFLNPSGNIILNPSDGKTGNVGIGMPQFNAPAEKLTVIGNIRASSLAGTGSRSVSADDNGTLTTAARTYTMMVPPQNFQRRYNTGGGTFTSASMYNDALIFGTAVSEDLVASVTMPVGATVNRIQVYFTDNDPVNNLSLSFGKTAADTGFTSNLATLFQDTNNPQPYTITTLTSALFSSQVTDLAYYVILVTPVNSTGNYGTGVWNCSSATPSVNRMGITEVKKYLIYYNEKRYPLSLLFGN